MKFSARRAQAEIIGTLILIASSALMTTLMLFWGLSLQGQSNTNFGSAIARTNAAAAEQISIDSVLFTKACPSGCSITATCSGGGSYCYTATVYARNFGDSPVRLAGVNVNVLASGFTPPNVHCEVTSSSSSMVHAVIVARAMLPVTLNMGSGQTASAPGCTASTATVFSSTWNGQTISIQIATDAGTQYAANFAIPS